MGTRSLELVSSVGTGVESSVVVWLSWKIACWLDTCLGLGNIWFLHWERRGGLLIRRIRRRNPDCPPVQLKQTRVTNIVFKSDSLFFQDDFHNEADKQGREKKFLRKPTKKEIELYC